MARKAFITGALPNFSGFENWVKIMRQNVIFRHSRLKAGTDRINTMVWYNFFI
jgi:hypothetical protein